MHLPFSGPVMNWQYDDGWNSYGPKHGKDWSAKRGLQHDPLCRVDRYIAVVGWTKLGNGRTSGGNHG